MCAQKRLAAAADGLGMGRGEEGCKGGRERERAVRVTTARGGPRGRY